MKKAAGIIIVILIVMALGAGLAQARQIRVVVDRIEYAGSHRYAHVWEDWLKKLTYRIAEGPDKDYITTILERMIGRHVFIYTEEDESQVDGGGHELGKLYKTYPREKVTKLGEPLKYAGDIYWVDSFGATQWIEPYPKLRRVILRKEGRCLALYTSESDARLLLLCDQYPLDAWLDEENQEIQLLNTYGEVHAYDYQGQYLRQLYGHEESEEVADIREQ